MVSNTLFSFLFALCALVFAVAASDAHLNAHLDARDYGYGYTTSTSTISSTKTVYRTVTIKKAHKETTISASVHKPTYASGAPYALHNTTTYAYPTHASPAYTVGSTAPVVVNPTQTTGAPAAKVTSNDAGRIGAWSGVIGFAAIVCASLF